MENIVKTFISLGELEVWVRDTRNRDNLVKEYPKDKYRITVDMKNLRVIVRPVGDKTEMKNILEGMKNSFPFKEDFDEADMNMLMVSVVGLGNSLNNMKQKDELKSVKSLYIILENLLVKSYGSDKAPSIMNSFHNQFMQSHMGIDVEGMLKEAEKRIEEFEKTQKKEVKRAYA